MAKESVALILAVKLLDFRRDGDWYKFRIKGGDFFFEAIAEMKKRILFENRRWDEDKKEWSVRVTSFNEKVLCVVFENGASCIETVKSQMKLF